ncbi:MAG: response regulator [Deltaproteobacteria bacterium]|nr:response regulator [Deltaproteobacteria bacterium]
MASHTDLNILVVDDDISIRKIVRDRLKMEGYTVTTAEDGKAGWEKFLENTYQLIITDINMPKINGIELLNKITCSKNQSTRCGNVRWVKRGDGDAGKRNKS